MAVRIPIVVDYNGKGLQKLQREFSQLDGVAAKSKFALQKALVPATATLAGLAAAGGDAVQAAMDDQKAQGILARTIKSTTGATNDQIKANEDWITTQGKLYGVTDDDLRPAMGKLVRVTKDVSKAQRIAGIAMDVSAGTGADLNTVTDAFTKALGGNMRGLQTLAPEMRGLIKDGASADEVMAILASTFGGQAQANAETAAGKMAILKVRMSEFREEIGNMLLPILENYVLPALQKLMDWAQKNPKLFRDVALALAAISSAVIILNVAMALNPAVLLAGAIAAVGAAAVIAYNNSEGFRNWVNGMADKFRTIYDWAQKALKPVQRLADMYSKITGGGDKAPWWRRFISNALTPDLLPGLPNIPGIPFMASGGIVKGPTLAMLGDNPGGMEAVIPLSGPNARNLGGGTTVNVNVNGGDPKAVVDAIVRWSRQNGPLPPQVRISN